MRTTLKSIAYHRNGITGEGFYAILFKWGRQNMLATAFVNPDESKDLGRIAIVDVDLAAAGNIAFSENSWRHEDFADDIVKWIKAYAGPAIT